MPKSAIKTQKNLKLVIVESPTKAKTIGRFLGSEYIVESSYGHVRDLPKSKIGIDTEHDFAPHYIIPRTATAKVKTLKNALKKVSGVILASDEDREGEAISWHLTQALELDPATTERIVFHEITERAIQEALAHPRRIDMKLVDAQQARRILDRLVGYELSPFLWKKVFKGLSAGRVQSVAVRLVAEREREIKKFIPEEFWSLAAMLEKSGNAPFEARLVKVGGESLDKFAVKDKAAADRVVSDLANADYIVENVVRKEVRRSPKAPFTTSTLQQEAANKLRFSAKQTMMLAQSLYENGFITYMRTDSTNLSADSLTAAHAVIAEQFGAKYNLAEPRRFKTKSKGAQEAHEAIRPSDPRRLPEEMAGKLEPRAHKLYTLIWRRFIACQMEGAIFDALSIDINAGKYGFRAAGSSLKFDGWLKVYTYKLEEAILPEVAVGEKLALQELKPEQHFTEPPARFNEASLIKTLEELGIGRPSTYAPTISTIITRNYIQKDEQRRLVPTETGFIVNDILVEHFPQVVDYGFTAKVEEDLDEIAEGTRAWVPTIREFYVPFHKHLEEKYASVEKTTTDETTSEVCEKCAKPMIIKHGRFGRFLACSGFPECRTTKNLPQPGLDVKCPKCTVGQVISRKTKRGRMFYGCSKYPDCNFAAWQKPTGKLCPECSEALVEFKGNVKCSSKTCKFSEGKPVIEE
ncbi:MAG: type I DNA topoisomerase [Candidatus Niyogibacteria bacterium]|nr:type I DNA topoisomerase [Candidatus Niyogibacteria bacterium]